jgi:hypothetical protein
LLPLRGALALAPLADGKTEIEELSEGLLLRRALPDSEGLALVLGEEEGEALAKEDAVSALERAALQLELRL